MKDLTLDGVVIAHMEDDVAETFRSIVQFVGPGILWSSPILEEHRDEFDRASAYEPWYRNVRNNPRPVVWKTKIEIRFRGQS